MRHALVPNGVFSRFSLRRLVRSVSIDRNAWLLAYDVLAVDWIGVSQDLAVM